MRTSPHRAGARRTAAPLASRRRRVAARSTVAFLLGVLAVLGSLALGGPAQAHAELVTSSPANGQTFQRSPQRLRLQFTETVSVAVDGIRLFDAAGKAIAVAGPGHPPNDRTTVDVALPEPLPDGGYAVAWRVVSADSHPISGAYTFTVGLAPAGANNGADGVAGGSDDGSGLAEPGAVAGGPPPTAPVATESNAATGYVVTRWFGFAALALLVGAVFFLVNAWPAGVGHPAARRLVAAGWIASLGATIASALAYGPYLAGRPLRQAFDGELVAAVAQTRLGVALGLRVGLLLLLVPTVLLLARRFTGATPPGRAARLALRGAVLAGAAALAITWSMAGHSATGDLTALALGSDVVHLVAMAVWLGGLVMLGLALLPARDPAALRAAVPAFSRAAAVSVAALVVTGLFQTWRQVRTLPALVETRFGLLLLAKAVVVLVILGLAAAARSWVRRHYAAPDAGRKARRPGPDPHQLYHFHRRVTLEVGLAVAVLAISATLANTEPAHVVYAAERRGGATVTAGPTGTEVPSPEATASESAVSESAANFPGTTPFDAGDGPNGRGLVLFDALPRRVGTTTVHVTVLDSAARPMAVPEVTLALHLPAKELGPLPVRLENAGPGHYLGTASLPLAGSWRAAVTIRVSEIDQTTVRIPLEVSTG